MIRVYLGLGANLGHPQQTVREAISALAKQANLSNIRASSLYASSPMGPADQPDYVNAVVSADTDLAPLELLSLVQQLEQQFGRQRLRRWGERTLDIDILLYGDAQLHLEQLQIPHVGLPQRDFVLVPLLELEPSLSLPNGQPLQLIWHQLQATQPGHDLVKIS